MTEPGLSKQGEIATRFMCLCLQGRRDPVALQAARDLAAREDLDWEALPDAIRAAGLEPLIYHIARDQDLLPPLVKQEIRLRYFQNARRNWLLFRELEDVLRRLTAESVPVILLKGAALAEAIYGNAAVRPMGDMDLLVRREDVPATLRVLAALGYETGHAETRSGDTITYENEVLLSKQGHAEAPIEVHWSLFDSPYYQHALSMDWFWQTALPARIRNVSTLVLGPEAQLLHLCGHLLLHHGGGGSRLLWLHDVAEVITFYGEQLDWDEVLAQAQACDLVLPVQQILTRVNEEWHALIPPAVLEQLGDLRPSRDEERVFAWLTAAHRPVARRFWADLASMPGWGARVRFAWRNFFPSADYMQHRYDIPYRLLAPLYYPYRWWLGLRSVWRPGIF